MRNRPVYLLDRVPDYRGELRVIGAVFENLPCARFLATNLKDQPNT